MLTTYLTQTRRLLLNPPAPTNLYSDTDLTSFINTARGQLSGENECIRVYATLSLTASTRVYPFSSIDVSSVSGVSGVFNIKQATVVAGSGAQFVHPRSFQWFNFFLMGKIVPDSGRPTTWAQYAQGANGSIYVNPVPDQAYTLKLDTVCLPVDLVDNSTTEAIPYPWTDCVPFFACYYAYMSAQRQADADKFYQRYQTFAQRARGMSNPSVLGHIYPQGVDKTVTNKLGVQPRGGRGGQ